VAGFVALWFFLSRHPCRVVTTSADGPQLEAVLWGEIRRFIQTSRVPLERERGGPLVVNYLHIRKAIGGKVDGLSYMIGRVSAKEEGMLGHHVADIGDGVPRTLFLADEASGIDNETYNAADTWAKRKLVIGNPLPCTNFFKAGVKGGDLYAKDEAGEGREINGTTPNTTHNLAGGNGNGVAPSRPRCYRKVVKIKAEDSPNVQAGLTYQRLKMRPRGEVLLPGVLPWADYRKRRDTWDPVRQCIGLDAEFWEGAEVLLYPPHWLNHSEALALSLSGVERRAEALSCDPGEGTSNTCWSVVDRRGLIEQVSMLTPDTSVIINRTLALKQRWNISAENIVFDRGGGGKQIADQLRQAGFNVRTVAFGEAVRPEPKVGMTNLDDRVHQNEQKYSYFNRRAELYGGLREIMDPSTGPGFALPARYTELRRQLAMMPLLYDREGRMRLPPKHRASAGAGSKEKSLEEIIGHSPDEADSLVLAVYALRHRAQRIKVGISGG
jgi:hypothetical protein